MSKMLEMNWKPGESIFIDEHFFDLISVLDERFKVVDYLMHHRSGVLAIGTYENIAKETGLSVNRVQSFMRGLLDAGALKRVQNGVYELPPALIPVGEVSDSDRTFAL